MKMPGQDRKSGPEMSADKIVAARTRKHNKKQEKNLICDEQMDYQVLKADEDAEHWVCCSEIGFEILAMLRLPKLLLKALERTIHFRILYC